MGGKKFTASETQLKPDPRYNSMLVAKFANCLMRCGKKQTAYRTIYRAFAEVEKKIKDKTPLEVFEKAIDNIKPVVEVKSKRVGGATYQVPKQIEARRRQTLAFRWVLETVRGGKGKPAYVTLANEILSAFKNEGASITKRDNVHKMAEANKAFAHFAR